MTYEVAIQLVAGWLPVIVTELLEQRQVFDMTLRHRKICGQRITEILMEASTFEDIQAKIKTFKNMIAAGCNTPEANK